MIMEPSRTHSHNFLHRNSCYLGKIETNLGPHLEYPLYVPNSTKGFHDPLCRKLQSNPKGLMPHRGLSQ